MRKGCLYRGLLRCARLNACAYLAQPSCRQALSWLSHQYQLAFQCIRPCFYRAAAERTGDTQRLVYGLLLLYVSVLLQLVINQLTEWISSSLVNRKPCRTHVNDDSRGVGRRIAASHGECLRVAYRQGVPPASRIAP